MRQLLSSIVILAGSAAATLGLAGCGGGASSNGVNDFEPMGDVRPSGMAEGEQMDITAPREAQHTLFCREFTGPNHAAIAERVKQQVEEITRLKDFYLVRGDQRTALYHGFYTTFEETVDPREAQRAQGDRELLEQLVDSTGQQIFPQTVFQPLDTADPTAPPEWDLRNADGYWTVLIATYTESSQRKMAAVESVRAARDRGIEAYFLHADGQSHVCVGTWPADAVKAQKGMEDVNPEEGVDPNDPPTLIVGMTELHPDFKRLRDHRGRPVRVVEMKVEPVDQTLLQALRDYEFTVNGLVDPGNPKPAPLLEIGRATGRTIELQETPVEPSKDLKPLLQRPF